MKTLSIVIPVYNSEKTIGHLCTSLIMLYAHRWKLDIVLVNDGSKDSTDAVCKSLQASHPDIVTYMRLTRNFGEHNAVIAGLRYAGGDCCVIMDDDFQNPPAEVGKLVDEIEKGYDVVYAQYGNKRDSWFRNFGSRLNDRMATIVLRKPADLYLSSFKVITRLLVKEIAKNTSPEPYLDAIILRITDNIGRVDVEHAERKISKSGYTIKKLLTLWGSMIISFSLVPLRFIGLIGAILSIYGIVYGAIKFYDDVGVQRKLSDFESLMFANMVFRGFVLMAISIVGEYIGRVFQSMSNDPQYVVRERFSSKAKAAEQVKYLKES